MPTEPGLRADARANRDRILAAAADVFVADGPDAPLERVAARAGVGIGTLYRRFSDRSALHRALVLDLLSRSAAAARDATATQADPFDALAAYLHRALDLRISAVIPALLGRVDLDDPELAAARASSAGPVEQLVEQARAAGAIRHDVTFADVGVGLVRISRPVPGGMDPEEDLLLAHRHLTLLLDGLRTTAAGPLPGRGLSLGELQRAARPRADSH